jgi:endonuclease-3
MNDSKRISKILELLYDEYPNSRVSLDYRNPYELLVATILSAQSTDKGVNKVLPGLFKRFPDVHSMSKSSTDDIKPYIKTIGLYNNKAKFLSNMARKVIEDFDGKIPQTMKELISLPGVARKTANVVLGNAFEKPEGIAVDTHVIRLINRMGFIEGKNAVKIERELVKIVPRDKWTKLTMVFIDHGRKICIRKPKCDKCVLSNYCDKIILESS